jgi:hypothetical protein
MSEREDWINLIRNEYDPKPNLGRGSYLAFDSEWDDGAGRIADAIIANKTLLLRRRSEDASSPSSSMTIEALADKLEAVSSLGGYIMESKEAAQIVTALRSISSLSAEIASTDAAKTCNSYLERALAAEYELDKAVSEITRLSAATARAAEVDASLRREADMYQSLYEKLTKLRDAAEVRAERSQARIAEAVEALRWLRAFWKPGSNHDTAEVQLALSQADRVLGAVGGSTS